VGGEACLFELGVEKLVESSCYADGELAFGGDKQLVSVLRKEQTRDAVKRLGEWESIGAVEPGR
jgi:hypothetical protein